MCKKLRKIYFVGIGMGSMDSLTEKARSVIADSDCDRWKANVTAMDRVRKRIFDRV